MYCYDVCDAPQGLINNSTITMRKWFVTNKCHCMQCVFWQIIFLNCIFLNKHIHKYFAFVLIYSVCTFIFAWLAASKWKHHNTFWPQKSVLAPNAVARTHIQIDRLTEPSHMDRIAGRLTARLTGHAERGRRERGTGEAGMQGQMDRRSDRLTDGSSIWRWKIKEKNRAFTGRTNRRAGGHIDWQIL